MKNQELKLTATVVRDAVNPVSGDYTLRDTVCRGLGLRVSPGSKTWIVRKKLRGQSFRHTVGHYPDMTLEQARKQARIDLGIFAGGKHPTLEREAMADATNRLWLANKFSVADMWADYIAQPRTSSPFANSTRRDFQYVECRLKEDPLWTVPFSKLDDRTIQAAFERLSISSSRQATNSGKTSGNLIFRYLRAAAAYSIDKRFKDQRQNPFKSALSKEWNPIQKRSRTIIADKNALSKWWEAVDALRDKANTDRRSRSSAILADYMILVLLWGGRKTETLTLKWEDIDFENKKVVFRETKNGEDHHFPLAPYAEQVLKRLHGTVESSSLSSWVFAATRAGHKTKEKTFIKEPKSAMAWVAERAGVKFSTHDLRRTFSNLLASAGIGADTMYLKMAMNHSGSDVTANHYLNKVENLRRFYIELEQLILKIAKATKVESIELDADELARFREWQAAQMTT